MWSSHDRMMILHGHKYVIVVVRNILRYIVRYEYIHECTTDGYKI